VSFLAMRLTLTHSVPFRRPDLLLLVPLDPSFVAVEYEKVEYFPGDPTKALNLNDEVCA
jgi:hypothetical protein